MQVNVKIANLTWKGNHGKDVKINGAGLMLAQTKIWLPNHTSSDKMVHAFNVLVDLFQMPLITEELELNVLLQMLEETPTIAMDAFNTQVHPEHVLLAPTTRL